MQNTQEKISPKVSELNENVTTSQRENKIEA